MRIIKKILPKSVTIKAAILSSILGGIFLIMAVFVDHSFNSKSVVQSDNTKKETIVQPNYIQKDTIIKNNKNPITVLDTSRNNKIPEWYLNPPTDSINYYAVATEISSDLGIAFSKSQMSALSQLSSIIKLNVSNMDKFNKKEGSDNQSYEDYASEITTITNNVLVGAQIEKNELIKEGKMWRSYIMVKIKTNIITKDNER